MEYLEVLGTKLKSDFFVDLFETYDVDVVYRYDRLHEGKEDEYVASIPAMGLEFVFDSSQSLTTLFMKIVEHDGFNPFEGSDPRQAPFQTGAAAIEWAKEKSIDATHKEPQPHPVFGEIPEWVRFNLETLYIHYQFKNGAVDMVTLGQNNA